MTTLLNIPITTAVAGLVGATLQLQAGPGALALPSSLILQGNFVWGSGGTSVDAWVQTSLDGGGTWCDVAHFSYAGVSLRNFLSVTSGTALAAGFVATDGGVGGTPIGANASKDGLFGPLWRCKYTTVGTYAGNTTLRIDGFGNRLVPSS